MTIAPWQMADDEWAFPDWPRPDLNIACLELLIGLVFLADPPRDAAEWRARQRPDPDRLRAALAPYAPAFELMGDGPRFMQDLEAFERGVENPNGPDMLFIDSAGGQTAKKNADLLVHRDRYAALDSALAAMALFTLQAHAPSGGAGNRTSMRGGGPLVTLVDPGDGLWGLIWANVPNGVPVESDVLPWMRPTRTSEKGQQVHAVQAHPVEAFFGMPRRLRLVATDGAVTAVVQRPHGTNYGLWEHPLTPYYRIKPGTDLLPVHPRAGVFGYRNWLGIVARKTDGDDTARRATVLNLWAQRSDETAETLVAGWAMDNMKPRDFTFSRAPLVDLDLDAVCRMEGLIGVAEALAVALRGALAPVLADGEAREAAREAFYLQTQTAFEARVAKLTAVNFDTTARGWLADLRNAAFAIFNAHALPGLADRDIRDQAAIVKAEADLSSAFRGYGEYGRLAYDALGLPQPDQKKGKAA